MTGGPAHYHTLLRACAASTRIFMTSSYAPGLELRRRRHDAERDYIDPPPVVERLVFLPSYEN